MLLRSSFREELQPGCGEEGNQKAFIFSPFRLCLYCQKPPCLNKPQSSQGRSHPAPDQDGGYKGPAILCVPETALTNNIVPEIPARLPEAAWGLYVIWLPVLQSCFPPFHRGWSLINVLHPKLSQCLFLENPDCNREVFFKSFVKFYVIPPSLPPWIYIILIRSIAFTIFLRIDWKLHVFLIKDLRRKGFWFFFLDLGSN